MRETSFRYMACNCKAAFLHQNVHFEHREVFLGKTTKNISEILWLKLKIRRLKTFNWHRAFCTFGSCGLVQRAWISLAQKSCLFKRSAKPIDVVVVVGVCWSKRSIVGELSGGLTVDYLSWSFNLSLQFKEQVDENSAMVLNTEMMDAMSEGKKLLVILWDQWVNS